MKRFDRTKVTAGKGPSTWSKDNWKGPKVLYVEDNEANWDITSVSLGGHYQLKQAKNSVEAFKLLKDETFDIILMDIELQASDLSGIEITRCLRGLRDDDAPDYASGIYCHESAIIFVTAYTAEYDQATLLEAGGDGLISKPVDFTKLNFTMTKAVVGQHHAKLMERYQAEEVLQAKVDAATTELRLQKEEADGLRSKAESQAKQLRQLDQQKTAFFQNISHELRTPLTLILNPLESQLEEQPNNRDLEVAIKNSRRLLRLVNQLLDFQKLEAGRKELQLQPLDLSMLLKRCGEFFETACVQKGIDFCLDVGSLDDSATPNSSFIEGESDALEKVVFNYLSNALKYTPQGGRIELGIRKEQGKVRLYVSDTGPGIDEAGQASLFEVFSRVDESRHHNIEGTGLGLAFAKSLVEEMRGQVGVESVAREGSTFWAEFPETKAPRQVLDVVLVDDDLVTLKLSEKLLSSIEGVETIETYLDAPSALERLKEVDFRCVIADYQMPEMNGLTFLKEVGQNYPLTRRVLLTGHAEVDMLQKAVNEVWIHQLLLKPVSAEEIKESIQRLIVDSPIAAASDEQSSSIKPWMLETADGAGLEVSPDEEAASSDDHSQPLVVIVDDLKDMRDLISRMLKKSGYRVLQATNGAEGFDLISKVKPDLIVSDWMMPKLSGPEMLKLVRGNPEVSTTPFILLTAKSDDESKLAGTELGADAFLGKPFNALELSSMVRNLLALKSREKQALEQAWLEAEVKSILFSEAMHHLNNPLSHIMGGSEFSSRSLKDHLEALNRLLYTDPIDEDTENLRLRFEDAISRLITEQDSIGNASIRASETVSVLRIVSGIDGVPRKTFAFREVAEFLHQRYPAAAETWNRLSDDELACSLNGDRALYGQAIEFILRSVQEQGKNPVMLKVVQNKNTVEVVLEFDAPLAQDQAGFQKACRLCRYLLKSFGVEVTVQDSQLSLSVDVM